MCACTCVVTQHMTSTQRTPRSSRTLPMTRRRAVDSSRKGMWGKYSTISRKNIVCNNSKEIKDFTKNNYSQTNDQLRTRYVANDKWKIKISLGKQINK